MERALDFRMLARSAVSDLNLRRAIRRATDTANAKRLEAFRSLPDAGALRDLASALRLHVLNDLESYLDRFQKSAEAVGAQVHRAQTGEEANNIVLKLLKHHDVTRVVKAKSMISEEIHLNSWLERHGINVVETDLGEYIVQMAGERPSHVTAPAIHKSRQQVGELFAQKLGVEYSDDPKHLTKIARRVLRDQFFTAQAGITGVNFAIAETGSLVLFTNEGNGRMVTGIPPIHVALMSIEKIIPSLADLGIFLPLLPRSATGQPITSYVSIITGTRRPDEVIGPQELHIIILDNGRRRILSSECREILKCIRCGACLSTCPVYGVVGGHSYGSTYSGPMGIILTVLLEGMEKAGPLVDATTLCGACTEACPVRVPLAKLLAILRRARVQEGLASSFEGVIMAALARCFTRPVFFAFVQRALGLLWPLLRRSGLPWGLARFPGPSERPFRLRYP